MGPFTYSFDYSYMEPAAEDVGAIAGFFLGFMLVFYLLMMALCIVVYVLQSLSLYTIAKRRGIQNPWLSWIPVGNMWILGSISDQYQYVAKGRVRNRRKVLMGLTIALFALLFLFYAGVFSMAIGAAAALDGAAAVGMVLTLVTAVALIAITITALVYEYIVIYDLFASCDPNNAVTYLLLSIFVSITLPFFFFVCRKKDFGMPPRKEAPQEIPLVEAVVETPADTAEE